MNTKQKNFAKWTAVSLAAMWSFGLVEIVTPATGLRVLLEASVGLLWVVYSIYLIGEKW